MPLDCGTPATHILSVVGIRFVSGLSTYGIQDYGMQFRERLKHHYIQDAVKSNYMPLSNENGDEKSLVGLHLQCELVESGYNRLN